MPKINVLDDSTINKIAAGEVIERPSSIIKELVENSIDAGADFITVEIENGGKDLIKIIDNGCGIEHDDINKAFMRHATSKISRAEDLYDLHSLGFRGEALASIAAVSKLEMITKTKDALLATKIILEGGKISLKEAIAANSGTQISVQSLFFNTPARRKFLKSNQSEALAITNLMNKLAIGNPQVRFKYINNKKTVFETLGDGSLFNLIRLIYGKDVSSNVIKLDYESTYFKIQGYIANNNVYRSNRNLQHIFINGRYVKSNNIMNVINESYKAIIPINKFPIYFINIIVDPGTIDVNIHPNKLEVKFNKENEILSELQDYIRGVLLKNSLIGKYNKSESGLYSPSSKAASFNSFSYSGGDEKINTLVTPKKEVNELCKEESLIETKNTKNVNSGTENHIKNDLLNEEVKGQIENLSEIKSNSFTSLSDYENKIQKEELFDKDNSELFTDFDLENPTKKLVNLNGQVEKDIKESSEEVEQLAFIKEEAAKNTDFENLKFTGIAFDTYVLFTKGDDMIMMDQHAAHERIRFELYMEKFKSNTLSIQMLMEPIIMELSPSDMAITVKNIDLFERFGFIIEEFGHRNISIRGVPNTFGNPESQRFIYEIIDNIEKIGSIYDTKYDEIAEIACKSAIKANDKISYQEAVELVNQLKECDNPYTCPHGRPIMVKMTKYDIEKMFKRKM
ncbi:DNA mismatch repair endonuclease MutL [Peptostreptococcus russellii]|uniref:DNA mismatch repair endonuclease MutL n=1 Tax=Peptostreptococcus russellii TaxID=215200 RepID=UPI001624C629|nr:DNA mismatch repair endonuclease MutL [Peptostreptococcus russellii]MBC2577395.1 DNA mismatch repair endonuclease MutL [Peptostreptococcus russellii]